MIQNKIKIGGAMLSLSLLLGAGVASSTSAQAQSPNFRMNFEQRDRDQRDRDRDYDRDRDRDRDRHQGRRHGRNNDGYPNLGGSFQLRQTALNAGYNEGNDRRRNRTSDFRSFGSFRKADKDYNRRDGDRELYRRYFQMAFETGYNDGLDGN